MIASFRHLDAVYKIEKSTGRIVWKLGGTRTPERLEVGNDPHDYTFGAQHDARLLPDGTVTVFDNRTYLRHERPRAVRFRINEQAGTATLVQSITDPAVSRSGCCGSARRLANGDWLIGWGGPQQSDRRLQAQRPEDLLLDHARQLPGRAGSRGCALGGGPAPRHERGVRRTVIARAGARRDHRRRQ